MKPPNPQHPPTIPPANNIVGSPIANKTTSPAPPTLPGDVLTRSPSFDTGENIDPKSLFARFDRVKKSNENPYYLIVTPFILER